MAKMECVLKGDFDWYRKKIVNGVLNASASATLEDKSDFVSADGKTRCIVRVLERYSALGDNRVSLTITMFQDETGEIHLSGITSGGSQAMLFKINTVGEETFLYTLKKVLDDLKNQEDGTDEADGKNQADGIDEKGE